MAAMDTDSHKKILAPSWEHMSLKMLMKATSVPVLLPIIFVAGWYVWYVRAGEPISSTWYSVILFFVYVLSFVLLAIFFSRSYQLTRNVMAVLMGFCGLVSGLIIAVVKLFVFFEPWAIFRLISEPIFTALFAGILGAIFLWGRSRLPLNSDKGIL
ncbi:MAG: hypothetical protein WC495_05945 [Patescibacteria group bacterium]|jgi:hypothetical protein